MGNALFFIINARLFHERCDTRKVQFPCELFLFDDKLLLGPSAFKVGDYSLGVIIVISSTVGLGFLYCQFVVEHRKYFVFDVLKPYHVLIF